MNKIGTIIVNWNSLQFTLDFLEMYRNSHIKGDQLVLVNNSPEDNDEVLKIKEKYIKVINTNKNLGYAGALNKGMNYLDKEDIDWILLINNDVKIDSKFIERLRSLKDRNTIYSPVITNHDSDIVQNTGGKLVLLYGGTINLNKGVQIQDIKKVDPDFLSGCCLFFHKEVLEKVGYLDESYGSYYEDVEWCFRAREKGVSLEVLWDLTLPHYHSMSTSNNSGFKDYLIAKNSIKFAKSDLNKFNASVFIFFSMLTGFFWVLPRPKNLPYFFRGVKDGLL